MFKNYFKTAWRNLLKNKTSSIINISGLAIGMSVALLIGLWINDELSFNKYHQNYDHIAEVMKNQVGENGNINTFNTLPMPLGDKLLTSFESEFKYVVMSSGEDNHTLTYSDKRFSQIGSYVSPSAPFMLSLKMLEGERNGLNNPSSIFLSASVAKKLFGNDNATGKIVKVDNKVSAVVTGVYQDLPYNSSFNNNSFFATWNLYLSSDESARNSQNNWGNDSYSIYVQLAETADINSVSAKIKNADIIDNSDKKKANARQGLFLFPMSRWHLFSDFQDGKSVGSRIVYVWLFAIIGLFVLLLACINFMNLSTAHSEKRAREVGIRKAIGSLRGQLVIQFFSESCLVVFLSFAVSLAIDWLILPLFNEISEKKMSIFWGNPFFWLFGIVFCLVTGLIAGSYPALYLSSFQPVKVLKGLYKAGRFAAVPGKVLTVLQFTVSVILIIGTITVFKQVKYAQNRPIGYDTHSLLVLELTTPDINDHLVSFRDDLLKTGAASEASVAQSPTTWIWNNSSGFDWSGKLLNQQTNFSIIGVSQEFGKTIEWKILQGRDFSRQFPSDSSALILNEAAVKYMGLKNPIGSIIEWNGKQYKVIGETKDMVMESPYDPARRKVFFLNSGASSNFLLIKINPQSSVNKALAKIESVFKRYSPNVPFDYKFVDEDFASKFASENRIAKLTGVFAILAIFISCLGLFAMTSFIVEQRTKEIGVRKVLGASVFSLWSLLSKEFVTMVIIALLIAMPIAFYFTHNWLQNYEYRTNLSWWIFAAAGCGALLITLITVSFQSIKAATANPVDSLRSE